MNFNSELKDNIQRWTMEVVAFAGVFGLCMLALVYQGNLLTGLARVVAAMCFLVALVAPRVMLYGLVAMATCLDTFKRLLGVFGSYSEPDLAIILSIAPLTLGGIFVGLVIHRIFRHRRILKRRELFLFLCAAGAMAVSFSKAFLASRSILRAGQGVTDGTAYVLAPLLIVALIPDIRAVIRFLRFTLWAFLPVALYGVFQFFFGLQGFELDYVKSGLTASVLQLDDVRIRVFSTLNSGHAYGASMAMLTTVAPAFAIIRWRKRASGRAGEVFLMASFAIGVAICMGRTAWAQAIMGICGIYFFTSSRRTKIFYGVSFALLVTIFLSSDYIGSKLGEWEAQLPTDSALQQQAFRLGTYSDRLIGFMNLTKDSSYWTPFGVEGYIPGEVHHGDRYFAHDAFTDALLRYGYVGVLFFGGIWIYFLIMLHGGVLRVKDRNIRTIAAALASACFSIFFSGFLSGSSLHVYPVNLLFWSFVGCILVLTARVPAEVAPQGMQTAPGADLPKQRGPAWRRTPGREQIQS